MSNWLRRNSLWLVGVGLMAASSGLDGVYMSSWSGWAPLGFVLNSMSDVTAMALTYWYGRLQYSAKKRGPSRVLLVGELVAVAYSWFFSWRQLRFVLPVVEPDAWEWVAPVSALYIPLLLAMVGYAQSLRDTRSTEKRDESAPVPVVSKPEPLRCRVCGATSGTSGKPFLRQEQLSGHMRAHSGNGHTTEHEKAKTPH